MSGPLTQDEFDILLGVEGGSKPSGVLNVGDITDSPPLQTPKQRGRLVSSYDEWRIKRNINGKFRNWAVGSLPTCWG